jgi:NDP-sugar pyrophosphorylase family protein
MIRQCVVLGGGKGTRMRPATQHRPKPLLSVAGEPFAVHQLRWLSEQGVRDVVYSIGHLGHMMRDELGARDDLGVTLRFVDEGEPLLGTGGAVRFAVEQAAIKHPFFVLYGDSYLRVDLRAVSDGFEERRLEALMTVFRNDGAWDTSNVVFDGRCVLRYDKHEPDPAGAGMHYIDYGLSVLRPSSVLERMPPRQHADLADLFRTLSLEGRLAGYEARLRFFEIGSAAGIADLRHHLRSHDDDHH